MKFPTHSAKRKLHVKLASPRGFCAGVERAIRTVEEALSTHGAPVYVRHEIVHNTHVVERLKAMGTIFVDSISDAPSNRPIIISAHGAPASVHEEARTRSKFAIDATCPLVLKVHSQTRRQTARGRHVILIGHKGHPEVEGILGQAPTGAITLIESTADAHMLRAPSPFLAYVTQTTLSVDDTAATIDVLRHRFPKIEGPRRADICYATSNRQAAVKEIALDSDLVFVIGSPASSNSCRLVEVALAAGCHRALLLENAESITPSMFDNVEKIGVTAGASAPEALVESVLERLARYFCLKVETVETAKENIVFKPPIQMAV